MWWRRNRLWVALLVPLLLLAIAATSFRMQRIHQPWTWSRPQVAQGPHLVFEQDLPLTAGTTLHRRVGIEVNGVVPVRQFQHALAAPGATLWAVQLQFTAEPDVVLSGCEVAVLDAAGVEYGAYMATVPDPDSFRSPPLSVACVPRDAPGPSVSWDSSLVPSERERPGTWRVDVALGLPEGVRPDRVVVRWDRPDYAVLPVTG